MQYAKVASTECPNYRLRAYNAIGMTKRHLAQYGKHSPKTIQELATIEIGRLMLSKNKEKQTLAKEVFSQLVEWKRILTLEYSTDLGSP